MSNNFVVKDYSGNDFSINRDGTLEITKKLCFIPCAAYLNQIDLYLDPQFPRINSYWKFFSSANTSLLSKEAEKFLRCTQIQNVGKLVSEASDLNSQNMTPWVVEATYELDKRFKKYVYASQLSDVWTNTDYPWVNQLAQVRTDSAEMTKSTEILFDYPEQDIVPDTLINIRKDFSNSAGDKFDGTMTFYMQNEHVEFDYPVLYSWESINLNIGEKDLSGGVIYETTKNHFAGLVNVDSMLRENGEAFTSGTVLLKPWNIEKREIPIVDFNAPSAAVISSAIYYHYSLDFIYNPSRFIETKWDAGVRASFERQIYDLSGSPSGTMFNTEQLYIMNGAYAIMSGAIVSANTDLSMQTLPVSEMEVCESYAKTNASNEFLMEHQRVLNMTHQPIAEPVQLKPDGTVDKDWYISPAKEKNSSKRYIDFNQYPSINMTDLMSACFGFDIGKILL